MRRERIIDRYHDKYSADILVLSLTTHLVRDGTVVIEDLQHLGLGQGLVPLADLVSVTHGLYQELGRHLDLGLAPVDLPSLSVLATLHDVSLQV